MASAFVLVNCHFPFDIRIVDLISEIQHVTAVHRTEGRYDLILKLNAASEQILTEIISSQINKIPGVDGTISLLIAKDSLTR